MLNKNEKIILMIFTIPVIVVNIYVYFVFGGSSMVLANTILLLYIVSKLLKREIKEEFKVSDIESLSHQLKQPLGVISIISSSQDLKHNISEEQKQDMKKILSNVMDINQTLDFFKKSKSIKVSMCKEINELKGDIDSNIKEENIILNVICEKNDYELNGGVLKQIIVNIVENSLTAIRDNKIKKGLIELVVTEEQGDLVIYIEDNGGGMEEELVADLFNRRLTTKKTKKGNGYGLLIVKRLIEEELRGSITISNINSGFRVGIVIPRSSL